MTARFVIRTVDEDWIDEIDAGPSRVDDRRAAWEEARRRVAAYPELLTVVISRDTGRVLWRSDPDIPACFEVISAERTGFDPRRPQAHDAKAILSSHKFRDDALNAFYDAVKDPRHDFLLVRDTRPGLDNRVIASSDDFSRAASA